MRCDTFLSCLFVGRFRNVGGFVFLVITLRKAFGFVLNGVSLFYFVGLLGCL